MKQILLIATIFIFHTSRSQEHTTDTTGLLHAFRKGSIHGHFRQFFMATDNRHGLSDYHANAIGGGIKYETAAFKGFRIGVSGFFIYNIFSSDLGKADPATNAHNRYEIGLFDIEDPYNKKNIDRLEELHLSYQFKKNTITFGKQIIKTPFINPQDSRMRPTEVEGIFAQLYPSSHTKIETGLLYNISPRSTTEWYPAAHSIGIYPQGINRNGTPGQYKNQLHSKGVLLAGFHFQPDTETHVQAWEYVAEHIFHTTFIQVEKVIPMHKGRWLAALQYIRQDAVGDGGNPDRNFTYFDPSNKVNIFGARTGWEREHIQFTLNYTRITGSGRFTFPREWGTEPLFTYLSRERNEGYGNVHAVSVLLRKDMPRQHLKTELGYGHYYLPEVNDYRLNKYGLPAYNHVKLWGDYSFQGGLSGMDIAVLYVHKGRLKERVAEKYLINKTALSHYSIILNYHF